MPRQRSSAKPTAGAKPKSTPITRRSSTNLPAAHPKKMEPKPAAPAAAAPSSGRSTGDIMKDMAATAAGVAVGSAVGHAVGAGITNAFSGSGRAGAVEAPPVQEQRRQSELVEDGPCAYEIRKFLKCTEENSDLTVCQGFNEAVQECRRRYNV